MSLINYTASTTLAKFHSSTAFVRGVMGPIGSGKSVGCCMEILVRAQQQEPGIDGKRKSRWIVVRNTLPQLETTTMKTWTDWFPEEIFGRITRKPPFTQQVKIGEVELEVIFLALDRDEDVKKLLSLETTGIWFNEAREIAKPLLDAATGRVGRYPSRKDKPADHEGEWPTWSGIIMDTNPPDDTHWWYKLAEVELPEGWAFFRQPSGLAPDAENLENLPKGYYQKMMPGKSQEWIDVYVRGKYGFIQDGNPVYGKNYNDDVHSIQDIPIIPNTIIYVGMDFGLTPCAIFAQKTALGQWQILKEIVTDDMDIPTFAKLFKSEVATKFAGHPIQIYGDPAGGFRGPDGRTAFDMLRAEKIICRPAPTNQYQPRKDAVVSVLNRMVNGMPGFAISKSGCPTVRRGFNGGYKYKKLSVRGDARFSQEPDKNRFSHPHDALQYLLCGAGEYRELVAKQGGSNGKTVTDGGGWNIFS